MFMSIATPEFGAVVLIEIRVLLAALFLLPFWWMSKKRESLDQLKQHFSPLLIVGALNSAFPFVLFAYSVLHVTGGVAAVLNATAPIWGAIVPTIITAVAGEAY